MHEVHFLHIRGILFEDVVYKPEKGFESNSPKRYEGPNKDYIVVLLDKEGQELLEVAPLVAASCAPATATHHFEVMACLPLHPDGTFYEIRKGAFVIYRCDIPPAPPKLVLKESMLSDQKISCLWESENQGITFNMVARMESGRSITLAKDLNINNHTIDLSGIRATGKGQLVIVACDGVRSSEVLAESFELPRQPPIIHIVSPVDGSHFSFGQPISVIASCSDVDGNLLSQLPLKWLLNSQETSERNAIISLENLPAGKHSLTLQYSGEMGQTETKIEFEIDAPDDAYHQWFSLVSETGGV